MKQMAVDNPEPFVGDDEGKQIERFALGGGGIRDAGGWRAVEGLARQPVDNADGARRDNNRARVVLNRHARFACHGATTQDTWGDEFQKEHFTH